MAFGQTDPARLDGSALRRWYLRSPGDIEAERRRRAEQAQQQFYGGIHDLREPNHDDSVAPATDADSYGHRGGWAQTAAYDRSEPPIRVAAAQARKPQATVGDCIDCHGLLPPISPTPGMLPPYGKFPIPRGFPLFRDLPGGAPPPPRREERKQCEIQERRDVGICSQQPTEAAKAECYSNIPKRRYHCDQTGEIGEPDLFTARRKSGRRWP